MLLKKLPKTTYILAKVLYREPRILFMDDATCLRAGMSRTEKNQLADNLYIVTQGAMMSALKSNHGNYLMW